MAKRMPARSPFPTAVEAAFDMMSTKRGEQPAAKLQRIETLSSLSTNIIGQGDRDEGEASSVRRGESTVHSSSSSTASGGEFSDDGESKDEKKHVRHHGSDGEDGSKSKELKPSKFIIATYRMLSDPTNFPAISFSDDGKCIEIKNGKVLSQKILANYFNHNNVSSFTRQLHNYGFETHASRKEDSVQIFSHPFFLHGREDLLIRVKRRVTQSSKSTLILKLKESRQTEEELLRRLREVEHEKNQLAKHNWHLAEEIRQLRFEMQQNHPVGPSRFPPQSLGSDSSASHFHPNPSFSEAGSISQQLVGMPPPPPPHSSRQIDALHPVTTSQHLISMPPPPPPSSSRQIDFQNPAEDQWQVTYNSDYAGFGLLHQYSPSQHTNPSMAQQTFYLQSPIAQQMHNANKIGQDGAAGSNQGPATQFGNQSDHLWFEDEPPPY